MGKSNVGPLNARERVILTDWLRSLATGGKIPHTDAELAKEASGLHLLGRPISKAQIVTQREALGLEAKFDDSTPIARTNKRIADLEKFATSIDPNWKENL